MAILARRRSLLRQLLLGGDDTSGILAPVLRIARELQETYGDSSVVLPMELGSLQALAVASTSSVGSGGVLAPVSEALFAKELCGLLDCLEATSPGFGKDVDCVLAGKASEDEIRKVEKSLMSLLSGAKEERGE